MSILSKINTLVVNLKAFKTKRWQTIFIGIILCKFDCNFLFSWCHVATMNLFSSGQSEEVVKRKTNFVEQIRRATASTTTVRLGRGRMNLFSRIFHYFAAQRRFIFIYLNFMQITFYSFPLSPYYCHYEAQRGFQFSPFLFCVKL